MTDSSQQRQEIRLRGIPASPGIAIGPAHLFWKRSPVIEERAIGVEDVEPELNRLQKAVERSRKELSKILTFARQKLGDDEAKIFEAQLMILEDPILLDSIRRRVKTELKNAGFIVYDEIEKYHRIMAAARDEYTRERANDVEDLRNRVLRNLHEEKLISRLESSSIIVSQNLTAADALILSRNDVLGYLTEIGGVTSHCALLARALTIPSVVGLHRVASMVQDGHQLILDGYSGEVILNPAPETVRMFEAKRQQYREFERRLAHLRELPAETLDGRRIELTANVELEQELEYIRIQGADGIGLYRTETLLLGKEVFPSEEEQFRQYQRLARALFPKPVVIRTFDIGGDKMMAHAAKENNPFLGWRGIRVMLDKPDLFRDQLRAILRASSRRNVKIMFPMVSSIKEVRRAKQLLEEVKTELTARKVPFDEHLPIGVMIEVPAAAVIAEDLAREVDFFSIGTNDLIQYLIAVDRSNEIVSNLYQEFHPAVVRFLRRILERGKAHNVRVSMCGEMAGDPLATILLVGLGLDEFSVVPTVLPEIKQIIRSVRFTDAKSVAEHALTLQTEEEIIQYLQEVTRSKVPEVLRT
jgi:phosphotransferase system enzyme I (PtsI)